MITVQVPDSMRDDLLQIVAASPFETDLSKVCRGAFQAAIARAKAGVATDVLAAEITHRAGEVPQTYHSHQRKRRGDVFRRNPCESIRRADRSE